MHRYLNAIRKSLSDDPQGRDEIIKDIELRISELLTAKIVDERQVVSESYCLFFLRKKTIYQV